MKNIITFLFFIPWFIATYASFFGAEYSSNNYLASAIAYAGLSIALAIISKD